MVDSVSKLRAVRTSLDDCRRSMLEVLDEIRVLVESGECEGFVLSACIGGRPARETPYTVLHRIPGLMPCEVVYVMEEIKVLAATSGEDA